MTSPLWTIDQLADAVERAFRSQDAPDQRSGRVREVPDKRTIRYYTTLGLVDRPAEMRGRTAYYGQRHLLQLVAIKRLQSAGQSLVQIQTMLAGADATMLQRQANLPADFDAIGETAAPPMLSAPSEDLQRAAVELPAAPRASFWAAPVEPRTARTVALTSHFTPHRAIHLKLAEGVTLVLEGEACERLEALPPEARSQLLAEAAGLVQDALQREPLSPFTEDAALCQRPPDQEPLA